MNYPEYGTSAEIDTTTDFFKYQAELDAIDRGEVKPIPEVKQVDITHQGDPHRMKKVGDDEFVDDYASNYTLPNLDDISWMRIELFHNKPGSHKPEWVIKFIINECDNAHEVNTSETTREVHFNLFSGRTIKAVTKKSPETDSFKRRFTRNVDKWQGWMKAIKASRPRGQKKCLDAPLDKVIAGFCYVRKAPWGTVCIPSQHAIILPGEADGKYFADMWLNQNNTRYRTIRLLDNRSDTMHANAPVMIGYYDPIGYYEWRREQRHNKRKTQ